MTETIQGGPFDGLDAKLLDIKAGGHHIITLARDCDGHTISASYVRQGDRWVFSDDAKPEGVAYKLSLIAFTLFALIGFGYTLGQTVVGLVWLWRWAF